VHFLVDENLPRSLSRLLRASGFGVSDVRDLGLRGRPDPEVLQAAISLSAILLTEDVAFGSRIWKEGRGRGVVLIRLPSETPTRDLSDLVVKVLTELGNQADGSMVVIGPDRYRLRKLPPRVS